MNDSFKKIFQKMEIENRDILSGNPFLAAVEVLSGDDIKRYDLPSVDPRKNIYIKNVRSYNDLLIGTKYDLIFSSDDPENYEKAGAEIDWLSIRANDNIYMMPAGQGGCVRLAFPDQVPSSVKTWAENNGDGRAFLFFTNQKVMDEILKELRSSDNVS